MSAELLTMDKLKEILKTRGFTIAIKPNGSASLVGRRENATPALMRVIAYYRDDLIEDAKKAMAEGSKS